VVIVVKRSGGHPFNAPGVGFPIKEYWSFTIKTEIGEIMPLII